MSVRVARNARSEYLGGAASGVALFSAMIAQQLGIEHTTPGVSAFLTANEGNELVLDDLGREPQFVEFGKRFEILPWIIEKRMGVTARTHFTTNFPKKYFDERYGYGLFDRMRSMAFHVRFEGESNRQLRPRIIFRAAAIRSCST